MDLLASDLERYAHLFPPPGCRYIELNNARQLTGVNETDVMDYEKLAPSERGVIRRLSLFSQDFSKCTFSLRVDRAPLRRYDQIRGPIGESGICEEVLILLSPGSLFELVANHTQASGVRWRAWGWAWQDHPGGER